MKIKSQVEKAREENSTAPRFYVLAITDDSKKNSIRSRYYAHALVNKADRRKIRRWLDKGDHLLIAADGANNNILITNETRIQATSKSRELFGIQKTQASA